MPGITVTLVDRTGGASLSHENFKAGIMHALEDILGDLIIGCMGRLRRGRRAITVAEKPQKDRSWPQPPQESGECRLIQPE
jgi:hypothetical protein